MKAIIVDYGIGNILSIQRALESVGGDIEVSSDPDRVARAERLVLPGVGAFEMAMTGLAAAGMIEAVHAFAATGRPLVGICLGMQMLFSESFEFGHHQGLGLVPGRVERFKVEEEGLKVPQIAWNSAFPTLERSWDGTILDGVKPGSCFYFVHSFVCKPEDSRHILAQTTYGSEEYCSVVSRDNVHGCQFHPEKSCQQGLAIYRNFLGM